MKPTNWPYQSLLCIWDQCVDAQKHAPPVIFRSPAVGALSDSAHHWQVRGSNAALSSAFNVSAYPTLLAVCNGDPALAERYNGELKSERIAAFLVSWTAVLHVCCRTGQGLGRKTGHSPCEPGTPCVQPLHVD